jgi:hypothetical protein
MAFGLNIPKYQHEISNRSTHFSNMSLLAFIFSAALIGVSGASDAPSTVEWGACDEALSSIGVLPVECSNITVPLDYADAASNQTLDIPLLRVPALKQPSKGSIIFHYGGPGPGGREAMAGFGEFMQVMTGQGFDLVSWDQRYFHHLLAA